MYLRSETYTAVAAFVSGYDEACEGGALCGFREWLVVRIGTGSNLAWSALVLEAAFPGAKDPEIALTEGPHTERHAIETLFDLLAEFGKVRWEYGGLRKVFLDYHRWEESQGKEL